MTEQRPARRRVPSAVASGADRPLAGRRVLVTRPSEQAEELSAALRALGADPVEAPAIRISPPRSWTAIDRAASMLGEMEWVVFTSANGVRFFTSRLRDARAFCSTFVAAVGAGTEAALASFGIVADLVPATFTTQELGRVFPDGSGRVLLARADKAEPVLEEAIRSHGWTVERITAYRIGAERRLPSGVARAVRAGEIDVVTFASAETVRVFMKLIGELPESVLVACIGPVTAEEATKLGLTVDAVASEHTIPGLAAAAAAAVRKVSPSA